MEHTGIAYLENKRTVDNRARSTRVRDELLALLPGRPTVLDVGAGTGVMLRNLLDWGVQPDTYLGIDQAQHLVDHANRSLPQALASTYPVDSEDDAFVVCNTTARIERGDILSLSDGSADLVIGQAVLDLVPIPEAIDAITRALRPGGLVYLPITFDGVSLFLPCHSDDEAVVSAYHETIDSTPGRTSRAGRELLDHLKTRAGTLIAVDASDWIVHPHDNEYPAEEAVFLEWILDFIETALENHAVDATDWLGTRRSQLENGTLSYVAHGYDFLYQTPA